MTGWLREDEPDAAAEKILDAAEKVFIEVGVSGAGMAEVASAAGCSRGTLYRYFKNRHQLHLAYVRRAAGRISERLLAETAHIQDPQKQWVERMLGAVRLVRANPGTAAWFAPAASGLGTRMSQSAEVAEVMAQAFGRPLGASASSPDGALRARWIIRVIVSLISNPAASEAEERQLLETFVAPTLQTQQRGRS